MTIVFCGPLFNILFAALIFFFSFLHGVPILVPEIGDVMSNTPAQKAGLLKGDRIVGIEGNPIQQWDEMTDLIHKSPGKPLNLEIARGDKTFQVTITPESKDVKKYLWGGKAGRPHRNTTVREHHNQGGDGPGGVQ